MTEAHRLYKKYSKEELLDLDRSITADPANKATDGGIYLYTSTARKKLRAIAEAVTFHLADQRAASGQPVPTSGFSGRKQNRR